MAAASRPPPPPPPAPPLSSSGRRPARAKQLSHRQPAGNRRVSRSAGGGGGGGFDPHRQQRYYGRTSSNVTDYLRQVVPSHACHSAVRDQAPPAFHRKASSITGYIESQIRGPRPPPLQQRRQMRPVTAPDPYFGRRSSNVTEYLRLIPPAHLGLHAAAKTLPYFGRLATSVTDPSKFDDDGDAAGSITAHWSQSRPGSARLPTDPQHVSREALFQALSARGERGAGVDPGGRRPTSIGLLLKHQFAGLADSESDVSKQPAHLRPSTAPAPKVKRLPLGATAASSAGPTPRASARPASARSATSDRCKRSATSSKLSSSAGHDGPTTKTQRTEPRHVEGGEAGTGAGATAVNDLGDSMAQSTLCDDESSEAGSQLASEKLEFVSKWVEQRPPSEWTGGFKDEERHKAWPKAVDKAVVDHSRRATSITKYNVW